MYRNVTSMIKLSPTIAHARDTEVTELEASFVESRIAPGGEVSSQLQTVFSHRARARPRAAYMIASETVSLLPPAQPTNGMFAPLTAVAENCRGV